MKTLQRTPGLHLIDIPGETVSFKLKDNANNSHCPGAMVPEPSNGDDEAIFAAAFVGCGSFTFSAQFLGSSSFQGALAMP